MDTKDSPQSAGGTGYDRADPAETSKHTNLDAITPSATNPDSEAASVEPEPLPEAVVDAFLEGIFKIIESDGSPSSVEPTVPKQPDRFTIHPLAEKFPALSDSDYQKLKASIAAYGVFEPIVINEKNQVLDGRHRWKACTELGKMPLTITLRILQKAATEPLSEEQFIYDSNIHRRHLTDDQRVMLATAFAPFFRKEGEKAKEEGNRKGGKSDPKSGPSKKRDLKSKKANSTVGKVAAKAGVSIHKAEQANMVEEHAPELSSAVASGEMPLKDAAKKATEKNAKTKEVFNAGIKPHSTRSVPKETTFDVFVLGLFKGVMADVNIEYPDKTREDVIKVICS
jgi:hypothetical protein